MEFREIASGLQFPEGPIWCSDGSLLLVEIRRGTLTRVRPGAAPEVVADCGGGPNGAAVGPDGAIYICNNGGFQWRESKGRMLPGEQPDTYRGGSIQRVELQSGRVETLYTECDGNPLRGPNDIVFDSSGGFWFTDMGKQRPRDRDRTGIYYARPDGSFIAERAFPLDGGPNGIGLSPAQDRLYVAETYSACVHSWEIAEPGELRLQPGTPHGGTLLGRRPYGEFLDSLAVDAEGNVCVATIRNGGITIFSPQGAQRHIASDDFMTTNICFGGANLRTAYLTLSSTGRLVACDWPTPGLPLQYNL